MSHTSKRQPGALVPLFATEMWERYGFYVIQSLLALFLTLHFKLSDQKTYLIVGTFTAISYITPIIGGFIADKLIGQKLTVMFGCVSLFASYVIISCFHSELSALPIALSGIALGTGLLKPNIACLVGALYEQGDPRRDGGFSIYYAGMALGILIGTTLPAVIHEKFGWAVTFMTPAFALFVALFIFIFGIKKFRVRNNQPTDLSFNRIILAIIFSLLTWGLGLLLLNEPDFALVFFIIVSIGSIAIVIGIASTESKRFRIKTISFLLLCIISVLFWTLYFQVFLSLTLFIHHAAEQYFLGIKIHETYYVAVESLGLVIIGPMLSPLFKRFYHTNDAIDASIKFLISIVFIILAFALIMASILFTPDKALISPIWLITAYLCISMAELLLSPIGLSMATKLVRPQVVGLMMGIFFVSLGVGGYLAGLLAQLSDINGATSEDAIRHIYLTTFTDYTLIACGILVFTFILFLLIKKMNLPNISFKS